jgi:hypothetical protein
MSWAQRRKEARKESLRKYAERFEASFDYDKAIFVWEQKIGDFEEAARVRGLKADYSTAAASVELPPPRDNQVILLAILAFIFLGLTVWFFFAQGSADEGWLFSPFPCCCSSVLFLIFGRWATKITEENKAAKDSVIAEKVQEVERQRKAVEEEKLRKQRARERSQRRKAMRQEANQRERALDYNSAIRIWEELGQIKEAARVRKLKARQSAIKQTVVHGDYVDDRDTTYIDDRDTIVKDSVISKSSIGAGGDDKLGKIKELKKLHDAGAIDDAEFKQMKKEILGK